MKNSILAITLALGTLCAVVILPSTPLFAKPTGASLPPPDVVAPNDQNTQDTHNIDVVFVLDTTGSMGGLIEAAKQKIWSIASTMATSNQKTDIRMGLVAYRDRGDAYVTKVVNLTDDLDAAYAELMQFQAQGGGDTREDVNQGLYDAVTRMDWRSGMNTYKSIFLVGDAPAHDDYAQQMQFPQIAALAKQKGIVINAIQCGQIRETTLNWQNIAQLGNGDFFQVEQNGSAVAIKTPFDEQIATLSQKLEQTRLHYGDESEKQKHRSKVALAEKLNEEASVEARARRGLFNISSSGKKNLYGDQDLVADISSGKTTLEKIDRSELPITLKSLDDDAITDRISAITIERAELKRKIDTLGKKRQAFVTEALEKEEGRAPSLDEKLYATIKKQAKDKGIEYNAEAPNY